MRSIPEFLRAPLEEFRAVVRAEFGARVRDVRLFGSQARGEAHEESDVDILVLIDGLTPMEQLHAAGLDTRIALRTGLFLAPLFMATERFEELRRRERLIAREIDADGISF